VDCPPLVALVNFFGVVQKRFDLFHGLGLNLNLADLQSNNAAVSGAKPGEHSREGGNQERENNSENYFDGDLFRT
jgi:hypothetical protein